MYTLDLTEDRFDVMYQGTLVTTKEFRTIGEQRLLGKLLDKLESISRPVADPLLAKVGMREFSGSPLMSLETEELELLKDCLSKATWPPKNIRLFLKVYDYLGALKPNG